MTTIIISVSIITILINMITRIVTRLSFKRDKEKISTYECGLNLNGDAREPIEISFYVVGIMYIMFDIEIAFIIPFGKTIDIVSSTEILVIMIFIIILIVGIRYEYEKKALEWQ